MKSVQNQNFDILNNRIEQLQRAVDESTNFRALRHDILKLKTSVKETELHPNARRKFLGWLTRLFYDVNKREKDAIFITANEVDKKLAEIEQSPFQSFDINAIREQCAAIKTWGSKNRHILAKKPDKSHSANHKEIDGIEETLRGLNKRLNSIQDSRTNHFRNKSKKFEEKLAAFVVEIGDLENETVDKNYHRIFEGLKELQETVKTFPRKKSRKYWDRISELFNQLKGIKRESYNAGRQFESQQNFQKFQKILDDIEDSLGNEKINNRKLNEIKNNLFNNAWNLLQEKEGDRGPYKLFLIRQHRDELFSRMRNLLEQTDDRRTGISEYKKECGQNNEEMQSRLEKLYHSLEEYRDEYAEGLAMKKGELLKAVGELTQRIKECHQLLKTGHFFPKDRQKIYAALNELWSDVNDLIQKIKNPKWSYEWLDEMIQKNNKLGGVLLQVVDEMPSPG